MRQQFFSFLIYCIAIFFSTITISFGQNTVGLNPEKKIHQYLIDNWTTDNGLPYNNLSHVFQAKNGYIWISTFEGLIRFDGKTFEIFTQKDFDVFKTNGIYQVDEDQEGRLWLGTQGSGLLSYQNGKMENTTPNFDKPISAVLASKNGVIWMGTINSGVYSLIDGRHEELVFEGLTKAAIRKIIEDDKGRIWIASEGHGLFMYDHGAMTHYTVEDKLLSDRVVALAVGKKGEVWVGTTKGLAKFSDGVFSEVAGFENIRITDLMVDNFGSLWVGTRQGCARMHVDSAAIEWLTQKDGLLGNAISAFTLDREGSMWLCTRRSGLSRIRDGKFVNYSQQMGLSARNINLIAEIAPNEYWIGSDNGTVDIFKEGKMDAYQLPQQFENARIKHLLKDSKGRIWMASYKGVLKIENGEQTYFAKEQGLPEVRARKVFEDRNGNIWVGFRSGGLAKYNEEEGWSIIAAKAGLASEFIMCLGEDKAGNLLVGTNGGGLNIINEQGEISVIDAKQGLNGTLIFNLHVDTAGIVWMATNAGIARYHTGDGNQVTMFSSKDGLPISTPFDIIEDDLGYFWMPSSDGIIRVLKQNIRAYEQGELNEIPYLMYNRGDGLISKECTPSAEVLKSSDGQLWFPNLEGFARINPNNIPINELIPEVQIKQFRVDDQVVDHHQTIVLEPGKKRFIIDFTALSFVSPPKMQFKYKLIGMDQDWVNVGEDRQAIYTNIPYGDHEFHVIASNNDGIWNNEGAVLKFQLKPFFYQTPWIYLIVFVIFVSLGFVIYRWRVRAIEQRNEELEKQVMERTAEINSQKEEIKVQRDQLSDSFTKMKTVSEMGREITSVLSVEELVQVVYGNVKELMDCDGFGIGIYNAQAHSIEFRGYIERGKVLADEFDKLANKKLLSVHCFDTQEPIFINDLFVDSKKYFPNFEFPNHGEVPKSLIYLPLSIDERKIGLITVQSFRQDAYTAENMGFLQTLANYITIALDNAKAYEIINDKNQDITDSLRYAQTIQQAILPSTEVLTSIFANHFLLFKPKDIVSGDFYWMAEKEGHIYLAVVDCTGHGVPGAFMSMIGTELLNELSNVSQTHNPALVLSNLDRLIYKSLNQEETKNTDGMDVCLCVISKQADEVFHVKYAGAKRPLFYTQQGEFFELKGDRKHIGGIFQKMGKAKQFSMNEITLKKGDRLYLTTDGFVDQASPLRKKIGTKRLKKIIKQKQDLAMLDQGLFLENYLKEHQQDAIQRDDITILGVEL